MAGSPSATSVQSITPVTRPPVTSRCSGPRSPWRSTVRWVASRQRCASASAGRSEVGREPRNHHAVISSIAGSRSVSCATSVPAQTSGGVSCSARRNAPTRAPSSAVSRAGSIGVPGHQPVTGPRRVRVEQRGDRDGQRQAVRQPRHQPGLELEPAGHLRALGGAVEPGALDDLGVAVPALHRDRHPVGQPAPEPVAEQPGRVGHEGVRPLVPGVAVERRHQPVERPPAALGHLLGLPGDRSVVRRGEAVAPVVGVVVGVAGHPDRLQRDARDAELLGQLADRAPVRVLPGADDATGGEVVPAGVDVLGVGPPVHVHPAPRVPDHDGGRGVRQVLGAHPAPVGHPGRLTGRVVELDQLDRRQPGDAHARHGRPTAARAASRLLTGAAVEALAQQVGVAAVAGVLLDHVDQHGAQLDLLVVEGRRARSGRRGPRPTPRRTRPRAPAPRTPRRRTPGSARVREVGVAVLGLPPQPRQLEVAVHHPPEPALLDRRHVPHQAEQASGSTAARSPWPAARASAPRTSSPGSCGRSRGSRGRCPAPRSSAPGCAGRPRGPPTCPGTSAGRLVGHVRTVVHTLLAAVWGDVGSQIDVDYRTGRRPVEDARGRLHLGRR